MSGVNDTGLTWAPLWVGRGCFYYKCQKTTIPNNRDACAGEMFHSGGKIAQKKAAPSPSLNTHTCIQVKVKLVTHTHVWTGCYVCMCVAVTRRFGGEAVLWWVSKAVKSSHMEPKWHLQHINVSGNELVLRSRCNMHILRCVCVGGREDSVKHLLTLSSCGDWAF